MNELVKEIITISQEIDSLTNTAKHDTNFVKYELISLRNKLKRLKVYLQEIEGETICNSF